MNTINIKLNNTEHTLKWNSSMRVKDFMTLNELRDETEAINIYELCQDAYKSQQFAAIDVKSVAKFKEELVIKRGAPVVKQSIVAFRGAHAGDDHLFPALVDRLNKKHSKAIEALAMARAGLAKERETVVA